MLLFVDGCSHYSQTFLADKWDVVNSLGTAVTQSVNTNGRFGGGAITFNAAGGSSSVDTPLYIQKNYDGVTTVVVGMAVQQTATQPTAYGGQWLAFMSGGTVQVALSILPSGQIQVYRATTASSGVYLHPTEGSDRTILGTSISAISSSSYDFMEVKIVHHPTTGSVEILRNGAAFYSLTNVNTDIALTANSSSMLVGGYSVFGGATYFLRLLANITDFYMLNTTVDGSDALNPVDFIGDRHWEPLPPTADGADTAWTITGSASHFANVDEVPPNTTDYNSTATLNARDGFVVTTPTGPTTATALLSATMYLQKNTGGSNAVKAFIRSAAPVYVVGTEFQVPTPWAFRQSFLCTKPGGGAITLADVASHQIGYQKTI